METKATSDFAKMFVNKTGDKMFIEIVVTGDPNEVTKTLYKSMRDNEDVIDGVRVERICFKGKNPSDLIEQEMDDALLTIKNKIGESIQKLREEFK